MLARLPCSRRIPPRQRQFAQRDIALKQPSAAKKLHHAVAIGDRWPEVGRAREGETRMRATTRKIALEWARDVGNEQPDLG